MSKERKTELVFVGHLLCTRHGTRSTDDIFHSVLLSALLVQDVHVNFSGGEIGEIYQPVQSHLTSKRHRELRPYSQYYLIPNLCPSHSNILTKLNTITLENKQTNKNTYKGNDVAKLTSQHTYTK